MPLSVATIVVLLHCGVFSGAKEDLERSRKIDEQGALPLSFVENRGQADEAVAYYLKGSDRTLFFTPRGVTFALRDHEDRAGSPERWIVKFEFDRSDPSVRPCGRDPCPTLISYFRGSSENWVRGIETCRKIVYHDLWPGIDLIYSCEGSRLKYSYIVRPGADPSQIRIICHGAPRVRKECSGRLICETPAGVIVDDAPTAYQVIDGKKVDVAASYSLDRRGGGHVAAWNYDVGFHDPDESLVIDPSMLIYCGYIGGQGTDLGNGIAVDAAGSAYVVGYTYSDETSFPVAAGPDVEFNGASDLFVAKVDPSGLFLNYCGYIGGKKMEGFSAGIAVDAAGSAYVVGQTASDETTFPVERGPDLTFNGGTVDVFVAKVDASGTVLDYCGYIGGQRWDEGSGVAVDGEGNAYVTGYTFSDETTFPVLQGPDLTFNGSRDVFLAKVNPAGTALEYCGYIGGRSEENGLCVSVDSSGRAYVGGTTFSAETSFPVMRGPDVTHNGGWDAFVARVDASGTDLDYCGFIGGAGFNDSACSIVVDSDGRALVAGSTDSDETTFPVKIGPDLTHNGGGCDAFVARIDASGTALEFCGYLGGGGTDGASGVAIDSNGNAYVAGCTESDETSFPVSVGCDLTFNGNSDLFLARVSASGTAIDYCGYLGGDDVDNPGGVAVDCGGEAFVTGCTCSNETSFPVIVGPGLSHNRSGYYDVFVARIPPHHILLRAGNVNTGKGDPADVLFVNNSSGEIACRKVTIQSGKPVNITIEPPPSGPTPASFVIYAWPGEARSVDVTEQPFDIGTACFPMPLSSGSCSPPPMTMVNNIGAPSVLGFPVLPFIPPAPCSIGPFKLKPGTYTIQGVIVDSSSGNAPFKLTNAVVIDQW